MNRMMTLFCLFGATVGFAQQTPSKRSHPTPNLDRMPVQTEAGQPAPIPVREGRGSAAPIPTWRTPPSSVETDLGTLQLRALTEQLNRLKVDTTNRPKPKTPPGKG